MRSLLATALVILALSGASMLPLQAQQTITQPLSEQVSKPLGAFLSASGWRNANSLLASARQTRLTEAILLIRITRETTCDTDKDLCLTIIGSLRSGGFVTEAVFYAGEMFEASNNGFAFGGKDGPTLFFVRFFGRSQQVIAAAAPTGWIVIPSGEIDRFKGRNE